MADNVSIKDANGTSVTVLSDEVTSAVFGTGQAQIMKIMSGAAGTTNMLNVNSSGEAAVSIAGTVAVSGSFYPATQPVSGTVGISGTVPVSGTFWQATQPVSGTVGISGTVPVSGPLTDTQLRASAVPVSLTSTTITGSVAVTGPLTDTQLRASAVPVSLASTTITNFPASQTVNGTVAISGTVPVSGTFYQATQPVSIAAAVTTSPFQTRTNTNSATVTLTTSTETTLIAAGGAGVFNDLMHLTITNSSASPVVIALRTATGGTVAASYSVPAGGGGPINFPVLFKQATANTAWTVTCTPAASTVYVNALYVKN